MISMIIPVYNVEKYLERCLESVFAQTYSDYEVVLVDDGSSDHSGELCDALAKRDARVRVIHKDNGGLSSARNTGLEAADGEYITFVDSDDVIHPYYLEKLWQACEETDADIAMGRLTRFKEKEALFKEPNSEGTLVVKTGVETLYSYFDKKNEVADFVSACCKLYKRKLFDEIRFPERRLFEDEFTTYRLYYKAQKVSISSDILYYYYVNDSGITRNLTLMKRCDEYDAQWERIKFFQEHQLTDLWKLALREYLATAQWDLRDSYKEAYDPKLSAFQRQYKNVLKIAQRAGTVQFQRDYDYFVLAYPRRVSFYRVLRQIVCRCKR